MKVKVAQLSPTLCYSMDCSPWNSLSQNTRMGSLSLLQGNLPNPGIEPMSLTFPALAGGFFTTSATWEDKYYDITYKWSIKMTHRNLLTKQTQTHKHRKQTYNYQMGKEWGGTN